MLYYEYCAIVFFCALNLKFPLPMLKKLLISSTLLVFGVVMASAKDNIALSASSSSSTCFRSSCHIIGNADAQLDQRFISRKKTEIGKKSRYTGVKSPDLNAAAFSDGSGVNFRAR